jgi:hypothetical protein
MGDLINYRFLRSRETGNGFLASTYGGLYESDPPLVARRPGHAATSLDELSSDGIGWSGGLATEEAIEHAVRATAVDEAIADLEYRYFEDDRRLLNPESVAHFKSFMRDNVAVIVPAVTANSEGVVSATWERGREAVIVRFVPNGQLHFALVLDDGRGGLTRPWGSVDPKSLFIKHPEALEIVQATAE